MERDAMISILINVYILHFLLIKNSFKFQAVGNIGRDLNNGIKFLINSALEAEESLIITKNVSELLFCGYEDNLINLAKKFAPFIKLPFDKFGWFYEVSKSF